MCRIVWLSLGKELIGRAVFMKHREYITIESVSDFVNYVLKEIKFEDGKNIYFRGEPKEYSPTIPGLYRDGNEYLIYYGSKEYYQQLLNELGYSSSLDNNKLFNFIAEIQHYGAVTRNIDITSNPLVSLFFACEKYDEDGVIHVYASESNKEKYSTGHTAAVKTALNFIDQKKINQFLYLMDYLHEHIGEKGEQRNVLSKTLTVDGIIEELKNSFKELTPNIENFSQNFANSTFTNSDIEKEYRGKLGTIFCLNPRINGDFVDNIGSPRKQEDIIKTVVDKLLKRKSSLKESLECEVKKEISGFLIKWGYGDTYYAENILDNIPNDFKITDYQDYLMVEIKKFLDDFMELLNQAAMTRERLCYPNAIYLDIINCQIVKSPKAQQRIINQNGLFILPALFNTTDKNKGEIQKKIDGAIKNYQLKTDSGDFLVFKIPKEKKKLILNELRMFGITDGFIYPDVEHQSKAILRQLHIDK